jgi:hypothetical protein
LTGYETDRTVYYRFVGQLDGTTNGGSEDFIMRRISRYTGLENVMNIMPLIVFVAAIIAGGWLSGIGFAATKRGEASAQTTFMFALGVVLLAIALFIFPVVLDAIENIIQGGWGS